MTIIRDSQILMLAVLKTASHSFSLIKKKTSTKIYHQRNTITQPVKPKTPDVKGRQHFMIKNDKTMYKM